MKPLDQLTSSHPPCHLHRRHHHHPNCHHHLRDHDFDHCHHRSPLGKSFGGDSNWIKTLDQATRPPHNDDGDDDDDDDSQ